jgi:succinate dehydrogenase / fumarate reductase membrane anchor subunit
MTHKRSRSPFDRTHGLSSARGGFVHWWVQRVTAVALIPLTLWFTATMIARARDDYAALMMWLGAPITTVLMVLFLIALFCHMALGLQVVIEDYVHANRIKIPTVIAIHLASFALAAAGVIATLRIALSG